MRTTSCARYLKHARCMALTKACPTLTRVSTHHKHTRKHFDMHIQQMQMIKDSMRKHTIWASV